MVCQLLPDGRDVEVAARTRRVARRPRGPSLRTARVRTGWAAFQVRGVCQHVSMAT